MKRVGRSIFFCIISLVLIACAPRTPDNNNDDNVEVVSVETNRNAYSYFYQSLAQRLDAEANTVISFETLLNDNVEYAKVDILKKRGSIYYSNIHDTEMVFTGSYVYFGNNYTNRAEITLQQFLVMSFNTFYEIELRNYLFSDSLTFTTTATGYQLNLEADVFPHVYSMDLTTNSDHALVDLTLTSQAYTFNREVVFSYEHPATVSGVPLATQLPEITNNRTSHLNNFFEMIEAMAVYSENEIINRQVYTSDNILAFPFTPSETYWTNQTGGLLVEGDSYTYFYENKVYIYEADYEPYFYQKVYYDASLSSMRFSTLGNLFWVVKEAMTLDITKSVVGTVTEYVSTVCRVVLNSGILDYIIEVDGTNFRKHDFDTQQRSISSPAGFAALDFLSDAESMDIGEAYNAYLDAVDLFQRKNTYEGIDPNQTDYSIELDTTVSLILTPVEVANMMYRVVYVYVRPTVYEPNYAAGEVLEVFLSTSTGKYRIYKTVLGILYQKLA